MPGNRLCEYEYSELSCKIGPSFNTTPSPRTSTFCAASWEETPIHPLYHLRNLNFAYPNFKQHNSAVLQERRVCTRDRQPRAFCAYPCFLNSFHEFATQHALGSQAHCRPEGCVERQSPPQSAMYCLLNPSPMPRSSVQQHQLSTSCICNPNPCIHACLFPNPHNFHKPFTI